MPTRGKVDLFHSSFNIIHHVFATLRCVTSPRSASDSPGVFQKCPRGAPGAAARSPPRWLFTPGMACAPHECEVALSWRVCPTSTRKRPPEQSDRLPEAVVLLGGTRKTARRLYGVDGPLSSVGFVRSLH